MTAPAAQKRKPKKPQAKPCKKATEREQRLKLARAKTVLAVSSSLTIGMLNETERCLRFDHKKYSDQASRVRKWGQGCLDLKDMQLGRRALDEAIAKSHRVQSQLGRYIAGRGPKGIGHYAVAWITLGYIVDEARSKFVATPEIKRRWNFFASTVNTFAEMFLEEAEEDRDYEALAGEASEQVWSHVFELPEGSWIRL